VAGKARVHELAKELGVTSQELLATLKEQGEFVKSASSTVEAPVARRLRESFAAPKPARPGGGPRSSSRSKPAPATSAPAAARAAPQAAVSSRPQLVTASEACKIVRVRPATIRKWVSRGYLRRVESRGRAALYDRDDLTKVSNLTLDRRKAPPISPVLNLPAKYHDRLITTTEAAKLLGVAPSTVRSWVTRGHLTPARRRRHGHLFTVRSVLTAADERGKRIWDGPQR